MKKFIFTIIILILGLSVVMVTAKEFDTGLDAEAELQEIYASGLAVSPDMVLPPDFINRDAILQELYAQNWGVAPNMTLPDVIVSNHFLLEELYAQNWAVSPNMDITR